MSIATIRGDGGLTGLAGSIRVSKGALRVEAYGTIDELNFALGFARAIRTDEDLKRRAKEIPRDIFRVGSALATPPESREGEVMMHQQQTRSSEHNLDGALTAVASIPLAPGAMRRFAPFEIRFAAARRHRPQTGAVRRGPPGRLLAFQRHSFCFS